MPPTQMASQAGLVEENLQAYWMPFTPNRQFKADPRILVSAEGMYYRSADGRKILDGVAGLWCVNAGHGRRAIAERMQAEMARLDYAPSFNFTHPAAIELAGRLAAMSPRGLNRVFFTNSGSESVDTALKIALAYHRARGHGERQRLIGRERAYHGVGFGGLSVGGLGNNRKAFGPLLAGAGHLPHTLDLEHNAFSRGSPAWGAHLADALERLATLHDASTIAAVIVEPVAGAGGVLPPPQGYLRRLREICDRHGILLIFDEVITGFGRLGEAFAADFFGVTPDIMTLAKGLTNAAVPMGAVLVRQEVHDAFMQGPPDSVELFHGYTCSGHPLACAAGLATLDIYRDEQLFQRAAATAPHFEQALHSLRGEPHVVDIRNQGLLGAIELEPAPDGRNRAAEVAMRCYRKGLMVRGLATNVIALSPPLIIEKSEIGELRDTLADALRDLA